MADTYNLISFREFDRALEMEADRVEGLEAVDHELISALSSCFLNHLWGQVYQERPVRARR
jgi:hypothetical protein